MQKCLNFEDESWDIDICHATPLLVYKQECVQKVLYVTDDQLNMDFVGPLLGPLSQIVNH